MITASRVARRQSIGLLVASITIDVLAVLAGYFAAGVIRFKYELIGGPAPVPDYWPVLLGSVALWPAVFAAVGLYDHRRLTAGWQEMRRIAGGVNFAILVLIFAPAFVTKEDLSRGWTLVAWPTCLATVTIARMLMRKAVHMLRTRGKLRMRLVIVGTNGEAHGISRTLQRNRWLGYDAVGFVRVSNGRPETPADLRETIDGIPVIGWTRRITEAVHAADADMVLIANSDIPPDKLPTIYRDLQDENVEVRISAGILNIAASRMTVEPLDGFPVLALRQPQLPRSQAVLKRVFDVGVASLLLLMLAPLFLAIAVAIKLDSRGPVFFAQERAGQEGRRFRMLKFRSMFADAEQRLGDLIHHSEADGLLFKMKEDPRVTRVGRVIRRWSFDELPQLLNVLSGRMSLVGPRPPLPREVEQYDRWLRGRLHVKPGITGLWQVNGRHELTFEDYVRYDLFYVRNWSVALDVSILWRTIPAVLSRKGSY